MKKNCLLKVILSVCLVLTVCLTFVSCDGGTTPKTSSSVTDATDDTSSSAEGEVVDENVDIATLYKAVDKPTVAFFEDYMLPAGGVLTAVKDYPKGNPPNVNLTIKGITKQELEDYKAVLIENGLEGKTAIFKNDSIKIELNAFTVSDDIKKSSMEIFIYTLK